MKPRHLSLGLVLGGVLCLLAPGCAHTPPGAKAAVKFPRVTLVQEYSSLEQTVRKLGEQSGGGLVVMNGIGERGLPPLKFKRKPYAFVVARLAEYAQCQYSRTPYYYFLYPAGYETLLAHSLEGRLHVRYDGATAALAFGNNTELFNLFLTIGRSIGGTIVADNLMAESRCGELVLPEAPLRYGLEAALQSARIDPRAYEVESTEEYLFFRSVYNQNTAPPLLNEDKLTEEQKLALEKRVSIMLPEAPSVTAGIAFRHRGAPLEQILAPLSSQLGIRVVAEAALADLPVNPCSMNNVRVRTVMDLLLRQWILPDFAYEMRGDRIFIRRRVIPTPPPEPAPVTAPAAPAESAAVPAPAAAPPSTPAPPKPAPASTPAPTPAPAAPATPPSGGTIQEKMAPAVPVPPPAPAPAAPRQEANTAALNPVPEAPKSEANTAALAPAPEVPKN